MSLFELYSTNKDKETTGIAITFPPNADGSIPTFFVSRQSRTNQRYAAALKKSVDPIQKQIDLGIIKNEVAQAALLTAFVDGILVSPFWQNIQNPDATIIPFTKANAKALFEKLPDLYDELDKRSKAAAEFRDASLEDDVKNS